MSELHWQQIISGANCSIAAGAARAGLSLLEPLYGTGVGLRNAMFDYGLRKPRHLGRPVISVGNLSAGGTGKTPMVMELSARLLRMGANPAILLRGYGSANSPADHGQSISDEVELHRQAFDGRVPVQAHPDRSVAARRVLQEHDHTDVFLLDDGFQRRQTHRDLDIVLVDATEPFGYGHLLPRGLLRESMRSLKRADTVIITRADRIEPHILQNLTQSLVPRTSVKASVVSICDFHWTGWRTNDTEILPMGELSKLRVFAFCGISNPSVFEGMLTEQVAAVVGTYTFPDHYEYDDMELLERLIAEAKKSGAEALVTTEKDWMKLRQRWDCQLQPLALYRPTLKVSFRDDGCQIDILLRNCLAASREQLT